MNINKKSISRKSWHYWLYSRTYEENKIPTNINICQFRGRVAISIPYIVLLAIASCMYWTKEKIYEMANGEITIAEELVIRRWHTIALVIIGYLYYHDTTIMLWLTAIGILIGIWKVTNLESAAIVLFFGLLLYYYPVIALILIGIIIAIIIATHSETWNLAKEYLKAQKEKICPIVEFEN